MTIDPEALAEWRSSVGRTETQAQLLDPASLARLAVATGMDGDITVSRPPLAHWAWFLDAVPDTEIGPDGHPERGGFLPPITLPRRMFAASAMTFEAPLTLGREAVLEREIADIRHKVGSTGDLVLADVRRTLSQNGTVCVRELQTIVYRDAGAATALPLPSADASDWGDAWRPGPVELFRFSAATFNAHRIHYDRAYAQQREGYPELIVHGPFTACKLASFARQIGGRPLAAFAFRASHPLFAGQPVRFETGESEGTVQARRCDGKIAMTAEVRFQS